MQLRELAENLGTSITPPSPASDAAGTTPVTGVMHNTEWVNPGNVFVAIKGAQADGHRYLDAAIAAGAIAVIGEGLPTGVSCPVPYLRVDDARAALALSAAILHGHPSRTLDVIGITGTDGKTTTSWMTRHLLRTAGRGAGLFSSVGYELPDGELHQFPSHFTTPEAPQIHEILAEMISHGTDAVVMETSSHALAMKRVLGVDFDVAVWTNLSPEHLELHGSMEQYFEDKSILVRSARTAVLNADDEWARRLYGVAPAQVTYSARGGAADWGARDVAEHPTHLEFKVTSPLGDFDAHLPMVGDFNVANALAAMATAAQHGASIEELQEGMRTFAGVPGRMQMLPTPADCPRVIIDFAHTAISVENLLTTLRPSTEGKLWIIVGSAGDRDPFKRGPIGEAAARLADVAIFTEEDPRSESVDAILAQMVEGAGERDNYLVIPDRVEAITRAIHTAPAQDTVVLAGKGPEPTMQRGQTLFPWNEENEALTAIASRGR